MCKRDASGFANLQQYGQEALHPRPLPAHAARLRNCWSLRSLYSRPIQHQAPKGIPELHAAADRYCPRASHVGAHVELVKYKSYEASSGQRLASEWAWRTHDISRVSEYCAALHLCATCLAFCIEQLLQQGCLEKSSVRCLFQPQLQRSAPAEPKMCCSMRGIAFQHHRE